MDIEAARGYTKLRDSPCPDIVDVMRQLEGATVDFDAVRHVHQLMVNEYWSANTQYYEMLRDSIDLSGEFEAKDIKYIRDQFWKDDKRDGVGLRTWIYSFSASDPTARQIEMSSKLVNTKLSPSPTRGLLHRHLTDLLQYWEAIDGNSTSDPHKLRQFYMILMESMSGALGNEGSVMSTLYKWLATKFFQKEQELNEPHKFVATMSAYAAALGMPEQGGSILPVTEKGGDKKRGNCDVCNSHLCTGLTRGGGTQHCLCFGRSSSKVPADASSSAKTFLQACRLYVKHVKPGSLKTVSFRNTIMPRVKEIQAARKQPDETGGKPTGKDGGNVAVMAGAPSQVAPPEPSNMEEFGEYIDTIFQASPGHSVNCVSAGPLDPGCDTDELVLESNDEADITSRCDAAVAINQYVNCVGTTPSGSDDDESPPYVTPSSTLEPVDEEPDEDIDFSQLDSALDADGLMVADCGGLGPSEPGAASAAPTHTALEDLRGQLLAQAQAVERQLANPMLVAPIMQTPQSGVPPPTPSTAVPEAQPSPQMSPLDAYRTGRTRALVEMFTPATKRGGTSGVDGSTAAEAGTSAHADSLASSSKDVGATELISRGLAALEKEKRETRSKLVALKKSTLTARARALLSGLFGLTNLVVRKLSEMASERTWAELVVALGLLYHLLPMASGAVRTRVTAAVTNVVARVLATLAPSRIFKQAGMAIAQLTQLVIRLSVTGATHVAKLLLAPLLGMLTRRAHMDSTPTSGGTPSAPAAPLLVDTVSAIDLASNDMPTPGAATPAIAAEPAITEQAYSSVVAAFANQLELSGRGSHPSVHMVGLPAASMEIEESRSFELGTLLDEHFISHTLHQLHAQWAMARRQPAPYVVHMNSSSVDSRFYSMCSAGQLGKAPWLRDAFNDPCNVMFTVIQGDNWLAGLLVRPRVGARNTAYILASYTHPKARCQGLQRLLVGMVERELCPSRMVRQADATEANDRVQLNVKLGFAISEWATEFVRSDLACGIMPSLLSLDSGDCEAMGKVAEGQSTSAEDVVMPAPEATAPSVVADPAIAEWVSSRSRRNFAAPVMDALTDQSSLICGRLVHIRQTLGVSHPSDVQLRMILTDIDAANHLIVDTVLDELRQCKFENGQELSRLNERRRRNCELTNDETQRFAYLAMLESCADALTLRMTSMISYLQHSMQFPEDVVPRSDTVMSLLGADSEGMLIQLQIFGAHMRVPLTMETFLSYVLVATATESYPQLETFGWADCCGMRSQCERRCGCMRRECDVARTAYQQEADTYLRRLRTPMFYTCYNSFICTSPRLYNRQLSPPLLSSAPLSPGFHHVMPLSDQVLGKVGNKVHMAMRIGPLSHTAALCDDGATVDCFCTAIGRIPGTHSVAQGSLSIGDSDSSLKVEGSYLHAVTRIGTDGTQEDMIVRGLYTPNGIANIISECVEVETRGTTVNWKPGTARCFQLKSGKTLPLKMTSNGLGWLMLKAVPAERMPALIEQYKHLFTQSMLDRVSKSSDDASLACTAAPPLVSSFVKDVREQQLDGSSLNIADAFVQGGSEHGQPASVDVRRNNECKSKHAMDTERAYHTAAESWREMRRPHGCALLAAHTTKWVRPGSLVVPFDYCGACNGVHPLELMPCVALISELQHTALGVHTGVGMGRAPKLSELELIIRTHVVLGHASTDIIVATLAAAGITISKTTIEEYVRLGCGICDSNKMRRRTFRSPLQDHTPAPVGKKWVMDTLHLRVAAALDGSWYITRFINKLLGASGKRRSYGHVRFDADTLERMCQRLRAFVRPIHGEILIVKRDSLPAQKAASYIDFLDDSSIHGQLSPPYCHEGVGDVEVTWQYDVPSANCLLKGSRSSEAHFLTAFYDVERSGNMACQPGKQSRDEIFYGVKAPVTILQQGLCYGSPVKFLVHPEIRDSKFDEHATPGIYRGPSREDESMHRGLVQVGTGAAMRHTTVDLGCMRIDERGVLQRSDRNHVDNQPLSLDPVTAAPAADFTRWHNPTIESNAQLGLWTQSSELPTVPTVVVLGSGEPRPMDCRHYTKQLSRGAVQAVCIDKMIGGYEHDWCLPDVNAALCKLVSSPKVIAVFFSGDCGGHSALRFLANGGPQPMFDSDHPAGIPNADGTIPFATRLVTHNYDQLICILRAAAIRGKHMLGESAPSRGLGSTMAFSEPIYTKHVGPWQYPPMQTFLKEFGYTAVYADQGAAGAPTMKTTEFQVSAPLLHEARLRLGTLISKRKNDEGASLVGGDSGDFSRSRASAKYPPELWKRIIQVLLGSAICAQPTSPATDLTTDAPAPLPASLARPRRAATDATYTKDGQLITAIFAGEREQCTYEDVALTIAAGRQLSDTTVLADAPVQDPLCAADVASVVAFHARVQRQPVERTNVGDQQKIARAVEEAMHASQSPRRVMTPTRIVEVAIPLIDVLTHEVISKLGHVAITDGEAILLDIDTRSAHTWHEPRNEKEYLRSAQKAGWRTAKELKMDEYCQIKMFTLIPLTEVPAGHRIYSTLWAHKIKFKADGSFDKFNPRWCLMGGNMDRDIYDSFSDVVRWTTVILIFNLRARYDLVDFHFDISNAFQSTRTDNMNDQPRLFSYQAPGFEVKGPNGEKLVCEQHVGMQGRIDAAALFGTKFGATIVKRVGCRRCLWDPEAFVLHTGPLATSPQQLEQILAACATSSQPATTGAPPGWVLFGKHVDDGLGVASSEAIMTYLKREIEAEWIITMTRWKKTLGFATSVDDNVVTVSAYASVISMAQAHLTTEDVHLTKMPYSKGILSVGPGVRPPEGTDERTAFDLMQTRCRSGLGWALWAMRAHPNMIYATTILCGHMSNPSYECDKHRKRNLAFELHRPCSLVIGDGTKRTLQLSKSPPAPFTAPVELGFHAFVDSNVGTPREDAEAPISTGTSVSGSTVNARSITGGVLMLGGAFWDIVCGRQHLTAPDSHTGEVSAAGTVVSRCIIHRGLAQEIGITMEQPTPVYCDSASCIFVANKTGAVKRSLWNVRRAAVLREAVDMHEVAFCKVPEADNVADGFTKPIPHTAWAHHMEYIAPHYDPTVVNRGAADAIRAPARVSDAQLD